MLDEARQRRQAEERAAQAKAERARAQRKRRAAERAKAAEVAESPGVAEADGVGAQGSEVAKGPGTDKAAAGRAGADGAVADRVAGVGASGGMRRSARKRKEVPADGETETRKRRRLTQAKGAREEPGIATWGSKRKRGRRSWDRDTSQEDGAGGSDSTPSGGSGTGVDGGNGGGGGAAKAADAADETLSTTPRVAGSRKRAATHRDGAGAPGSAEARRQKHAGQEGQRRRSAAGGAMEGAALDELAAAALPSPARSLRPRRPRQAPGLMLLADEASGRLRAQAAGGRGGAGPRASPSAALLSRSGKLPLISLTDSSDESEAASSGDPSQGARQHAGEGGAGEGGAGEGPRQGQGQGGAGEGQAGAGEGEGGRVSAESGEEDAAMVEAAIRAEAAALKRGAAERGDETGRAPAGAPSNAATRAGAGPGTRGRWPVAPGGAPFFRGACGMP